MLPNIILYLDDEMIFCFIAQRYSICCDGFTAHRYIDYARQGLPIITRYHILAINNTLLLRALP